MMNDFTFRENCVFYRIELLIEVELAGCSPPTQYKSVRPRLVQPNVSGNGRKSLNDVERCSYRPK